MKLQIHRIKSLNCPYCQGMVDGTDCKPMSETQCESCGASVKVPGAFASYLIYSRLEREPLSAIYSAFDNTLERSVALRVVDPDGEKSVADAMMESARRIAAINHLNVARVHRVDTFDGVQYIEGEVLLGGSLQDLIDREEMIGEVEAIEIIRDIARGMQVAHDMGIAHLDISPEHIRFDRQGIPKITSFANHRLYEAKRKLIGSPLYVSPEAAVFATGREGTPAPDTESDIYSLGVCFYHLLSKQPPFERENAMATVKARFKERPPVLSTLCDISAKTEEVIYKMMEPKAHKRPTSMAEVAERLDGVLESLSHSSDTNLSFDTAVALNFMDMNQQLDLNARMHQEASPEFDAGERTLSVALASVTADVAAQQTAKVLKPMDTITVDTAEEADPGDLTDWDMDEGAASVSSGLHGDDIDDSSLSSLANALNEASASRSANLDESFSRTNTSRAHTHTRSHSQSRHQAGAQNKSSKALLLGVGAFVVTFAMFFGLMSLQDSGGSKPASVTQPVQDPTRGSVAIKEKELPQAPETVIKEVAVKTNEVEPAPANKASIAKKGQAYGRNSPWLVRTKYVQWIEAEHFDEGGQGVGYFDRSPERERANFRKNERVGIFQNPKDNPKAYSNGMRVGRTRAGEWLAYSIEVKEPGDYLVSVRCSAETESYQMRLTLNDQPAATFKIHKTGSWFKMARSAELVSLPVGRHTIKFHFEGAASFDNFCFESIGKTHTRDQLPFQVTLNQPIRIQAEAYDLGGQGVAYNDKSREKRFGDYRPAASVETRVVKKGQRVVSDIEPAEWLRYTVAIPESGNYQVRIHVASDKEGAIHLRPSSGPAGYTYRFNTEGIDSFKTITQTVSLREGVNFFRFYFPVGEMEFDWFEISRATSDVTANDQQPSKVSAVAAYTKDGKPWPIATDKPLRIQAENFDRGGEGVSYHDVDAHNQFESDYRDSGVDILENGGTHVIGHTAEGEWLKYTIDVPMDGAYQLRARGASEKKRRIDVFFGGYTKKVLAFKSEGSEAFVLDSIRVRLRSGVQFMKVRFQDSGIKLDWLALELLNNAGQIDSPAVVTSVPPDKVAEDIIEPKVIDNDLSPRIEALTLFDNEQNKGLRKLEVSDTIDLEETGRNLNLKVRHLGNVKSVKYALNGVAWVDSQPPFLLSNASSGWYPSEGLHTLEITAYSGSNATGEKVDFKIYSLKVNNSWQQEKSPAAYTPTGRPHSISSVNKTTIEAYRYDFGGQGVGYHDSSHGNSISDWRSNESVDIAIKEDVSPYIDNIRDGEWLSYTVDVKQAGEYLLSLSAATERERSRISVQADSKSKALFQIPGTNGEFLPFKQLVTLGKGEQKFRIYFVDYGPKFLSFSLTPKHAAQEEIAALTTSAINKPPVKPVNDQNVTQPANSIAPKTPLKPVGPAPKLKTNVPVITRFVLVNSETDKDVAVINDGDVFDLSKVGGRLNVRADASGPTQSVKLALIQADHDMTESIAPYALFGDDDSDYHDWLPGPGTYAIKATPYEQKSGGGKAGKAMEVKFELTGHPGQPWPDTAQGLPWRVPKNEGKKLVIEAARFDGGGEGVAYHDKTKGNKLSDLRPEEDVDILYRTKKKQPIVSELMPGEWLAYTIHIPVEANYIIRLKLATPKRRGQVQLYLGDKEIGRVKSKMTASWHEYDQVGTTVRLSPGIHVLKLLFPEGGIRFHDMLILNQGQ